MVPIRTETRFRAAQRVRGMRNVASPSAALRTRLVEDDRDYRGVIFRFVPDDGKDRIAFALGVSLNGGECLSFVDLFGQSLGYGRAELPPGSRYREKRYTVDRRWITENFREIEVPRDISDVFVCIRGRDLIRASRLFGAQC